MQDQETLNKTNRLQQQFKSYNNDDITDVAPYIDEEAQGVQVAPEAEKGADQHEARGAEQLSQRAPLVVRSNPSHHQPPYHAKKPSDNASVLTNTNTVTTYLTNNVGPAYQNHHIAPKRTNGNDLNQVLNPRMSTNQGELSESNNEAAEEYARTVMYSSTTSRVENPGVHYVTDNASCITGQNQNYS